MHFYGNKFNDFMTFQKGKSSWNKGKKHTEEWKKKMSERLKGNIYGFKQGSIPWNKGISCSENTKKKISENKKGNIPWNKGKKGVQVSWNKGTKGIMKSNKTSFKKEEHRNIDTEFKKGEMSEKQKGEKNSNWQGGKSFEPYTIDWTETLKRSIRERDKYLCQVCNLYGTSVHHIDYKKSNCNPENLITLCGSCHRKTGGRRDYWLNFFTKNEK